MPRSSPLSHFLSLSLSLSLSQGVYRPVFVASASPTLRPIICLVRDSVRLQALPRDQGEINGTQGQMLAQKTSDKARSRARLPRLATTNRRGGPRASCLSNFVQRMCVLCYTRGRENRHLPPFSCTTEMVLSARRLLYVFIPPFTPGIWPLGSSGSLRSRKGPPSGFHRWVPSHPPVKPPLAIIVSLVYTVIAPREIARSRGTRQ